jgi:hypothetical protein
LFQETRTGGGNVVGVDRGENGNWRFETSPVSHEPI